MDKSIDHSYALKADLCDFLPDLMIKFLFDFGSIFGHTLWTMADKQWIFVNLIRNSNTLGNDHNHLLVLTLKVHDDTELSENRIFFRSLKSLTHELLSLNFQLLVCRPQNQPGAAGSVHSEIIMPNRSSQLNGTFSDTDY